MYTSLFWKDLLERLVSTLIQAFGGLLAADVLGGSITTFAGLPWEVYALALFVTAVMTVGKAFGALQKGDTVSPASFAAAAPDLPAVDSGTIRDV